MTLLDTEVSTGLTDAQAQRLRSLHGENSIPQTPPPPLWRRAFAQLSDPLIVVLGAAALLTALTGDLADTAIIALVVLVNTVVGVAQEIRADRAVAALSAMATPVCRVVRDGREIELPSTQLVPGDLIVLAEGDVVPADAEIQEAAGLRIDESALTGESMPVDKTDQAVNSDRRQSQLSSGTVVVHGRSRAVVTATGALSALGQVAGMLAARPGPTPLQIRLRELSRILAVAAIALCLVVFLLGLLRGEPFELMALTAVSLVVAAVPESLPAVVTVCLALAARRMARRHAIVRRLAAVETLGAVTLLATDKTGTLTSGRMSAERLWTPRHQVHIVGGAEARVTTRDGTQVSIAEAPDVTALVEAALLCNDASGEDSLGGLGDPTEIALLGVGDSLAVDRQCLMKAWPRVAEVPFDSIRKRMTTVHGGGGRFRLLCKGAPELLLTEHLLADAPDVIESGRAAAEDWARRGYRVLAVAVRDLAVFPANPQSVENEMVLLGLIALVDPPRVEAQATILGCRMAGIRPVLVTGDHPATASAIADRVGIDSAGGVVDLHAVGIDGVDALSAPAVLARATPGDKLELVSRWRRAGHVVAMTGDGVNDGPALRKADIGVAMGRRGTEVARQAADVVLADDELGSLVAAVEEGRRVYANVRRFLLYAISGGVAEILVMLAGPFVGLAVPLLPAQILWVNLLTHGLAGTALGAEPADPATMRRPPRPPSESVLGAGLWQRIGIMGVFLCTVSLLAGLIVSGTSAVVQSVVLLVLGGGQLGVALGVRAPRSKGRRNPSLGWAVFGAAALLVAAVTVPALHDLLGTVTPPWWTFVIACLAAFCASGLVRITSRRPPAEGTMNGAED